MSENDQPQNALSTPGMLAIGLSACAEEIHSEPDWLPFLVHRRYRGLFSYVLTALNPARKEARGLRTIAKALVAGDSMESALNDRRSGSQYLRSLIYAGMLTGKLPAILSEYIQSTQNSRLVWRGYWIAMSYPVCLLGIAAAMLLGFVALIVPQFKSVYEDFGIELPIETQVLIHLSDMLNNWWPVLAIIVLATVAFVFLHSILPFAALRRRWFYHVPLIGTAVEMAGAAEFCSRLAVLMESEILLPDAMRVLSPTLRDPHLAEVSSKLAHRFQNGFTPEDVSKFGYGLGPQLAGLFRWGHQPKIFADGLRASATMFAAQVRVRLSQFGLIVEPIAIVLVVLGAGFVMVSMFMPLIKLLYALS